MYYKSENKNLAGDQLLKRVCKDHWIRIRNWASVVGFWMVGCSSYRTDMQDIKDFCYWAIDNKLMKVGQQLNIMGYDGTEEVFKASEGGIEKFLMEEKVKRH